MLLDEQGSSTPIKHEDIPTGIVAGLKGEFKGESFLVKNVIYPGIHFQLNQSGSTAHSNRVRDSESGNIYSFQDYIENKELPAEFIIMISGLELEETNQEQTAYLTQLKQFLFGNTSERLLEGVLNVLLVYEFFFI